MAKDFKVAVLISSRGSNFRSLASNAQEYKIIGVLSDRPDAPGLGYAKNFNIPAYAFSREDFVSIKSLKERIAAKTRELNPDLVCLAGFMLIIQPEFIAEFPRRMLNIHPSLLPKFPGLDTHRRALHAGESEHGCTVHLVDNGVDTGPVIAQARCKILKNDTTEVLAERVLSLEHRLYPWVVNSVARGDIRISPERIDFSASALNAGQSNGFRCGCSQS